MCLDHPVDPHKRVARSPDLIGQRQHTEQGTFAGKTLGLAVERMILAVRVEHQHGEETGAVLLTA